MKSCIVMEISVTQKNCELYNKFMFNNDFL
jgi:hypothetical protein